MRSGAVVLDEMERAQDGSVTVTSWIGYMAILWFSILLLVNNTYNPFIYFRF